MTSTFGWKALGYGALMLALTAVPAFAQETRTERLSDTEAVALIEKAKTPTDHQRLAAYYQQSALDFDKQAKQHKALAAAYRRLGSSGNSKIPSSPVAAKHCDSMAAEAAKAAVEARTMAEHHAMLAKEATR